MEQKLLCMSYDLESARIEANEEISKNKEDIKHLLKLLQLAYHERDEARNQLKRFLHHFIPSTTSDPVCSKPLPCLPPPSPLTNAGKANSGITESNSLSEAHNPHSTSSPVDSFFDSVSSPDLSNINMADSGFLNQPLVQDFSWSSLVYTATVATGLFSRETKISGSLPNYAAPITGLFSQETDEVDQGTMMTTTPGLFSRETNKMIDQESLIIYSLTNGRSLPQRGKLLQAVMEAGPLLQTLMVAGPLPRWRNPPPLETFQIPQVSTKGIDGSSNGSNLGERLVNSSNYTQISCGSSQIYPTSVSDFAGVSSGLLLHSERILSCVNFSSQNPNGQEAENTIFSEIAPNWTANTPINSVVTARYANLSKANQVMHRLRTSGINGALFKCSEENGRERDVPVYTGHLNTSIHLKLYSVCYLAVEAFDVCSGSSSSHKKQLGLQKHMGEISVPMEELLQRAIWNAAAKADSPWVTCVHALDFKDGECHHARRKEEGSWIFNKLLDARDTFYAVLSYQGIR
ncbi:hypothetical protein Ancab_011763 [Ancistrocladus abbreviatus]